MSNEIENTNDQAMEQDMQADLIVLTDEEGNEHQFELVDSVEHNGETYVALFADLPPEEMLEDDGNLVIMKIVAEENGEEILELIEDDEEFEEVSEIFMERLSDLFDFEEEQE